MPYALSVTYNCVSYDPNDRAIYGDSAQSYKQIFMQDEMFWDAHAAVKGLERFQWATLDVKSQLKNYQNITKLKMTDWEAKQAATRLAR